MLEVNQRSSTREVKAAYHRVALANHPDKVRVAAALPPPRAIVPSCNLTTSYLPCRVVLSTTAVVVLGWLVPWGSRCGPAALSHTLLSLLVLLLYYSYCSRCRVQVKNVGSADALEAADKFMKVQKAFETVMESRKKVSNGI